MSTPALHGVTDIDTLALAVRDRESKRLIAEAITAYRGGALRSAIMSTWIAVAFDIISKARELAAQGEAAPKEFVDDLDLAIDNNDIRKMQTIESDLLKTARDKLQMFASHEFDALERLRNDRHLCAHPAFVVEDELYQPSLELVRSHIVHALKYLLINAPLQGKSAIARFDADIVSLSFPTDSEEIGAYIRSKYLNQAKDALVQNLIKALISAPFGDERVRFEGRPRVFAMTLREVAKAKTAIYDSVVKSYVAKKFDVVDDDVLLNICPLFESDTNIWSWISESARIRIKRLLKIVDVELLKAHSAFDAFVIDELSEVLLERFDGFDQKTQASIISDYPNKQLVSKGIEVYSKSGGFRTAEDRGRSIILPLSKFFTANDIKVLLEEAGRNENIWCASGTPAILEELFDNTRNLLPDSLPYWQEFIDRQIKHYDGNTEEYYTYPGLQNRLATL
ncbi:hypothetical protein [Azotobacter chroococcum]|uniref:hypothetical protein n=1 Tax=Azotobacter chroococcum TaxID=353 RepID=UPI0010ADEA71|nr:hypothetical protein [Azotobacter chroococcum]TKD45059.1 hypothetical protein FCG41_04915 [Azotobacter chroococcum]